MWSSAKILQGRSYSPSVTSGNSLGGAPVLVATRTEISLPGIAQPIRDDRRVRKVETSDVPLEASPDPVRAARTFDARLADRRVSACLVCLRARSGPLPQFGCLEPDLGSAAGRPRARH
jgi:hypothetical protein